MSDIWRVRLGKPTHVARLDERGTAIAVFATEADAALAVRAVNLHDEMAEALREGLAIIETIHNSDPAEHPYETSERAAVLVDGRALLAKLEAK